MNFLQNLRLVAIPPTVPHLDFESKQILLSTEILLLVGNLLSKISLSEIIRILVNLIAIDSVCHLQLLKLDDFFLSFVWSGKILVFLRWRIFKRLVQSLNLWVNYGLMNLDLRTSKIFLINLINRLLRLQYLLSEVNILSRSIVFFFEHYKIL